MRHHLWAPCVLSLLLSVPMSTGACSINRSEPEYGHAARTIAEYQDESKSLQLALGWAWPTELNYHDVVDGKGIRYEINLGRVDAAWYWHCSWARTFLDATNQADKDAALAEVLKLKTSAFYRWGLDDVERRRRDKVLADASRGNVEELKQIIDMNCPVSSK